MAASIFSFTALGRRRQPSNRDEDNEQMLPSTGSATDLSTLSPLSSPLEEPSSGPSAQPQVEHDHADQEASSSRSQSPSKLAPESQARGSMAPTSPLAYVSTAGSATSPSHASELKPTLIPGSRPPPVPIKPRNMALVSPPSNYSLLVPDEYKSQANSPKDAASIVALAASSTQAASVSRRTSVQMLTSSTGSSDTLFSHHGALPVPRKLRRPTTASTHEPTYDTLAQATATAQAKPANTEATPAPTQQPEEIKREDKVSEMPQASALPVAVGTAAPKPKRPVPRPPSTIEDEEPPVSPYTASDAKDSGVNSDDENKTVIEANPKQVLVPVPETQHSNAKKAMQPPAGRLPVPKPVQSRSSAGDLPIPSQRREASASELPVPVQRRASSASSLQVGDAKSLAAPTQVERQVSQTSIASQHSRRSSADLRTPVTPTPAVSESASVVLVEVPKPRKAPPVAAKPAAAVLAASEQSQLEEE